MNDSSFASYFMNNQDIWFNPQKKYDRIISEKFSSLLNTTEIFSNLILVNSNKELFEFILIFDQLPYYVFRDDIKKIEKYQKFSYQLASQLIDNDRFNDFTNVEKCFIMLPLRHSNNLQDNYKILKKVIELRKEDTSGILKRFYRATLLKIGILINDKNIDPFFFDLPINKDILDENCQFTSLYECFIKNNTIISNIKNKLIPYDKICVSISGGVDSILLLYIAKYLEKDVIAIHINYSNRDTSDSEMNNVINICNYLRIPIYVRKIEEIQRDNCERTIYEDVTRKIRFDFYKKVTKDEYIIALGHNRDDCIENIFTNIIRNKNYDVLKGMRLLGSENDVNILRPMLDISKSDIYKLANQFKLPYLYDSTPDWSERGKLRDNLIPSINNFNSRIIPGLEKLAEQIDSMNIIYEEHIKSMVSFSDSDIYLCKFNEKIFSYDYNFFNRVMSYVCKEKKMAYFTQKSLEYLYKNQRKDRVIKLCNGHNYINLIIYK